MSKYKIHRPEGAPDWFEPGIECEYKNQYGEWVRIKEPIVWFRRGVFIDAGKQQWSSEIRPVKQWQPVEGEEEVAAWDNGGDVVHISTYIRKSEIGDFPHKTSFGAFAHIARLKDDNGNPIALTGGPEKIKERTDWL